jgi:hypothetical protein
MLSPAARERRTLQEAHRNPAGKGDSVEGAAFASLAPAPVDAMGGLATVPARPQGKAHARRVPAAHNERATAVRIEPNKFHGDWNYRIRSG